jgi:LysR family transcriptional regulator, hydrogen peroxide-inducible genes activator
MELHQVRYFLAVAEELNFSRAAEKCNVSQPALSRAIILLEHEFGGPLFHRERRLTNLSPLGRMVRPYLEEIARESDEALKLARQHAGTEKHTLKLGIMTTVAPSQFTDLIMAVPRAQAGIDMMLSDANSFELERRLVAGEIDAAIYALPGKDAGSELHLLPLFREQMVIAVHPGHRFANQEAVRVKDLSGEAYIHRNHCEFAGYADGILQSQGVTVAPAYFSDSEEWTQAMIAAGLGFGFMPRHSVNHPDVVALPVIEPEFWRTVNLVTVTERAHSPALGVLVREAMRKEWFGAKALAAREAQEVTSSPTM